MPNLGDIAVLRYGNDAKWHWAFLPVSGSTTLYFDSDGASRVASLPMSVIPSVKPTIDAINASGGASGAVKNTPAVNFTLKSGFSMVVPKAYNIPSGVNITLESNSVLQII